MTGVASERDVLIARLFFRAAFPVMKVPLEDDQRMRARFADVRAKVQFKADNGEPPLGCWLSFDRGGYKATEGICEDPDLTQGFGSVAKLNALLTGGFALPRLKGALRHPVLLVRVLLLLMSLTPGFLAFVTLGLLPISDSAIRISAALFVATIVLLLTFIPRARLKVPAEHQPWVGLHIFVPMSLTFIVIVILQALIAAAVIDQYEFTIYYDSLVIVLLLAVVQFARLILARPVASSEQSPDDA